MAEGQTMQGMAGADAARPPTRMENHCEQLEETLSNLRGIRTRIISLGDRFDGTQGAKPESEKATVKDGILGQIEDRSSEILNTIQGIKEDLARVEELL